MQTKLTFILAFYAAPFVVFPYLSLAPTGRFAFPVGAGLWINTRGHPDSNLGPPDWEAKALTTTPPIGAPALVIFLT